MEGSSMPRRKMVIAAVFALILLFIGFMIFNQIRDRSKITGGNGMVERIPVYTTLAKKVSLKDILTSTGDIRPLVEVNVYPKAPGRIIRKILVEKGNMVRKGDLVAVLEDETIRAQINEAESGLALAEANLEVTQKDYVRMENLYNEKAVAKQKFDHIVAQKKSAAAQVERAQAVLKQLRILHGEHNIPAPVDGYVAERYVDPGAMSSVAQPIIRISSEQGVKVITQVTEQNFPHVKQGMACEVRVDAFPDRIFKGTIAIVNPTLDPATRTADIEIHIPNKDRLLRSGMYAYVSVHLGEKTGIAVARDSLNRMPGTGSYYVYVVENGKAVLKNIKTGVSQGDNVEITEGLREGEQVVVKGQNKLKDGVPVDVTSKTAGKGNNG